MKGDIFVGTYVCLYPETGHYVGVQGFGPPFQAAEPNQVKFWESLEAAQTFAERHNLSYHRVERLEILQQQYTY